MVGVVALCMVWSHCGSPTLMGQGGGCSPMLMGQGGAGVAGATAAITCTRPRNPGCRYTLPGVQKPQGCNTQKMW